tara:strand:+ start:1743 stop:1934 length:192 start_codon:yes stop_codon:yes gene_type:complete
MGWMKRIYTMCQEGTIETEFTKPYHQALSDEEDTMMFHGRKITMEQAEGISELVKDAVKMFKT